MVKNISWRQFEAGREYNRRISLYENVTLCERFYRGDQWKSVHSGSLPTPVFNFIRRITDFLISKAADSQMNIIYSDNNLPFIADENHRERIEAVISLLNRHASHRWSYCRMDRLIRQMLLDAAISGDGVLFTYWDPTIRTGQAYTGDFVTVNIDNTNVFVANVNSKDLQSQEYVIISGRESVSKLQNEALAGGASREDILKIRSDEDVHYGAGDCASIENSDIASQKATYIIKFFRNKSGYVCFEKSTKDCIIKTVTTGLRLYPITIMNWIPTKNSYHGTSPILPLIQNQKYVNKAYALMMKHMIDSAFSKVVYDKTRIPEWTNEVGQAIGVVGGDINGVASTLSPGEMDENFADIINSVIKNTKESMGATDVSLGEAAPTNTSAIVALQDSNNLTLDYVRSALYTCMEELADIWVDFMCAYYADGRMVIADGTARPLDCRILREELIAAQIEIGPASRSNKAASVSELSKLLEGGHITFKQYLERIPDGIIPKHNELLEELNKISNQMEETINE